MTDPTLLFIAALALLSSAAGWVLFWLECKVAETRAKFIERQDIIIAHWRTNYREAVHRISQLAIELQEARRNNEGEEWKQEDI